MSTEPRAVARTGRSATTAHRSVRPSPLRSSFAAFLTPAVLLVAAACGPGEEAPDAAADPATAEAPAGTPGVGQDQMALMMELQAIDQQLGPIREQAMQDPELQEQQQELIDRVEAEMEKVHPGSADERARFDSLRAEFGAAQQAGEQERVQALGAELQSLQTSLQETQGAVLEQTEIAAALEAFRENLRESMRAADPRADSLLDRAEELNEELRAAMPGAADGG